MGKGQVYRYEGEERDAPSFSTAMERAKRMRNLAAYNIAAAEKLEAEAREMMVGEMREYVDSAELITVEA